MILLELINLINFSYRKRHFFDKWFFKSFYSRDSGIDEKKKEQLIFVSSLRATRKPSKSTNYHFSKVIFRIFKLKSHILNTFIYVYF